MLKHYAIPLLCAGETTIDMGEAVGSEGGDVRRKSGDFRGLHPCSCAWSQSKVLQHTTKILFQSNYDRFPFAQKMNSRNSSFL